MKLNKFTPLFLILILLRFSAFSQGITGKGYYQFPINPGQINYLSGNMSELRPNHFHAGLDIKTGGRQGLPIYAAADGYVSRIKASAWGYGNVVYITHLNGTTTVYAHLQSFNKELSQYMKSGQYAAKSFELELFPKANELKVSKGDVIAYSGNSGSSGGPHLHFEIRDSRQHVLDPLVYGFDEIKDRTAPSVEKIALITLSPDARINGNFGRFEYPVSRVGNTYSIPRNISVKGQIGLEILAYDRLDGAANKNGVPYIEVLRDSALFIRTHINSFSFADTRMLLLHTNYPVSLSGPRYTRMYLMNGNGLPFYTFGGNHKGVIELAEDETSRFDIEFHDAYKNKSSLSFTLKGEKADTLLGTTNYSGGYEGRISLLEKTLVINSKSSRKITDSATVYSNGLIIKLAPAIVGTNKSTYLWDMRKGLPDSVKVDDQIEVLHFKATIPSTEIYQFNERNLTLNFRKNTLYDTLYLKTQQAFNEYNRQEEFTIHEESVPLNGNLEVIYTPLERIENQNKTHVYKIGSNGSKSFIGGTWVGDKIKFQIRNFGTFALAQDTIPPTIRPIMLNSTQVRFVIKDELSGLSSYEVKVNGEWLLMHYDYKQSLIWSDKKDDSPPLKGDLVLKVVDNAGNEKIYQTKL